MSRCEICGVLTEAHSEDVQKKAYAIGNSLITKSDPLTRPFKNNPQGRRELTDILENLWTDFSDECKCKRQTREEYGVLSSRSIWPDKLRVEAG